MRHSEFRGVEQSIFYILLLELPLVGSKWLLALLFLNRQVLEVKIIQFSFTLRSPATHVLPGHRQGCACLPSLGPEVALVCFAPCQKMPCATLKRLSSTDPVSTNCLLGFLAGSSSLAQFPPITDTEVLIQQRLLEDLPVWFKSFKVSITIENRITMAALTVKLKLNN